MSAKDRINLKRGVTLLTPYTKNFTHEEWSRNEAQEKSKIFTDFFESNQGTSRKLVCTLNPSHPDYETLPDLICVAVNNHEKLKEALKPFAALAKHFDGTFGMRPTTGAIQAWDDKYGCDELTVEMLKQAETLLASLEK